jgi:hypothetical protein
MSTENTPQIPTPQCCNPKLLLVLGGVALLAVGAALGFFLHRPHHPGPFMAHARFGEYGRKQEHSRMMEGPMGMDQGMGMRPGNERRFSKGGMEGPGMEMRKEITQWARPIGKIREKYRGEIANILRPEQKSKLEESTRQMQEHRGPGGPGDLMGVIIIGPQADRIASQFVLDDAQKKQVEAILKKQREEVLAWIDSNPPPKMEGRSDRGFGANNSGPRHQRRFRPHPGPANPPLH